MAGPPSCNEVLAKCDAALNARNVQIKDLGSALDLSINKNTQSQADLNRANEKLASPIRNPFLMIALGAVVGVLGGAYLMRK